MNTNENQNGRKPQGKLEQLPPEKQSWLLEIATHSTLIDMVQTLKEEGIETSTSALSRFVQKHREKALLEAGQDMKAGLEALAERGKEGKLREGTLEAVRQRFYERALVSNSAEEAREMYEAMVKEEARLKELELEARKVAALEQQVKLQGLRIHVMAQQGTGPHGGRRRVKAEEVTQSIAVTKGEQANLELPAKLAEGGEEAENETRLLGLVTEALEILNRGGDVGERLLEARAVLAEGMKGMGAGG